MVSSKISFAVACACLVASEAFTVQNANNSRESSTCLSAESRRSLFQSATAFSLATIATVVSPNMANAAGKPPSEAELQRIKVGYAKLTYLLDNFDAETTICRENGGECKRDADPVRKYLGLRSTTDPLFQIEKVFEKVKYMDIDPDQIEIYFEAIEEWNTAQNMSNSMAFISQFAEYNPGGGKDEVLKYLEEAKKQVVIARSSLEKIIRVIDL